MHARGGGRGAAAGGGAGGGLERRGRREGAEVRKGQSHVRVQRGGRGGEVCLPYCLLLLTFESRLMMPPLLALAGEVVLDAAAALRWS